MKVTDFRDFGEEPVNVTRDRHVDVVPTKLKHEFKEVATLGEVICGFEQKPVHRHSPPHKEFEWPKE